MLKKKLIENHIRRDESISLPATLKNAIHYKVRLRQDLMAMFRDLGPPQIFITWSINLQSPGFLGPIGSVEESLKDVALFCGAFKKEWHRVWTSIHKTWSNKVLGGTREFSWVLEYQEQGAPHIHMVLWTGKTAAEVIDQNNRGGNETVVSCSRQHQDARVRELVEQLQIHRHTKDYCLRTGADGSERCRFGFPRPVCPET